MRRELSFIKMHGCGNDYVFLDCFSQAPPQDPSALSAMVSDRHRSIGGDGLVLMLPSTSADARMRMFNSDGSEGAMCGNALRCLAMWLHQTRSEKTKFRIAMQNRIVEATIVSSSSTSRTAVVSVNMGPPVPIATEQPSGTVVRRVQLPDVVVTDGPASVLCVSMGNPHAVLFVPDLLQIHFDINGPAIERHAMFPDRTNVEFVQPLDTSYARVRVWERGSGETLACGSGACAVAVAGISAGVFPENQTVLIDMAGGPLQVTWPDRGDVFLQGPAEEAFRGTLNLDAAAKNGATRTSTAD